MDNLINKVISGNASKEEKDLLDNWIMASEENGKYYERQLFIWELIGKAKKPVPEVNVAAAWERFQAKQENVLLVPMRRSSLILRIAAVFVVLLMAGGIYLFFSKPGQENATHFAKKDGHSVLKTDKNAIQSAQNNKPEQDNVARLNRYQKRNDSVFSEQIDLVDSSYAKITDNSVLKILNHTPNQPRIASLSGAGLFDIKPLDKDFILETEELKIKVQGTKFNVKTATEEYKFVEISVQEGFMEVFEKANPSNRINISSNQTYLYDVERHQFTLQSGGENSNKTSKWKTLVNKIFKQNKKY